MPGNIVLVRQERPHTAQLEDAFVAAHCGKLVHGHELLAQLLIVERVGYLAAPAFAGIVGVDGFTPQRLRQLLERGTLLAAQEQHAVAVAHDGVGVVLVDGFELGLRLQYQTGRDLTAADGGNELFQAGNLPDVGALVDQAPHMDGQPAAVHIIGFLTQKVEQLGIAHGDQEVERIVRVAHDEKQRGLSIAQRVQLQLVICRQLP